jgi:F0F1-type ATP synthase epsilon subunit
MSFLLLARTLMLASCGSSSRRAARTESGQQDSERIIVLEGYTHIRCDQQCTVSSDVRNTATRAATQRRADRVNDLEQLDRGEQM